MVAFDEMQPEKSGLRQSYAAYDRWLKQQDPARLTEKMRDAERVFRKTGITFAVYGEEEAAERLIPFDIVPRILSGSEWRRLTQGIEQRVQALNAFLDDIYHRQEILRAGRIPKRLIAANDAFLPEMIGMQPPAGVYTHIIGVDIVRTGEDEFFVLEDNARTPSGVSYMLENRETMMQLFPELFQRVRVRPVENYPQLLRQSLARVAPGNVSSTPTIAVLTPGSYNSAYFEHAFLADQMGVELVEGHDLRVVDGHVAMRTTEGYKQIDVLYRRVDDAFLDPLSFRPDSALGVPGIMDVYRAGNITIANAPGTGIADDKAIYSYMPEIIEFYTGRKAILENIRTWRCSEADSLKYVQENLGDLVVKEVHGSGGYGMLVGPTASKKEREAFAKKLAANPGNYIAQPTLSLSTCPILTDAGLAPRHVDLRPFVLVSDRIQIVPGGLTRVALKKGSLVVNSSQGGGTKDTWVLDD
ncbi:circularly permuted type 2 ATP-grasp protein [Mesorhizobium marinum]|uniref:Circularly permuted type 2 ATP-grasp protein n=1 Tax=Mesorhizobium marinum TaxID=3228790 RepID=A0ABV3R5D3_9HYPH